jgi:iron complex outermembrane receptor protein
VDDEENNTDVSAKLGARWQVADRLSLHGTVSRDFRAPSAAQTYFLATEQVVSNGAYREQGTYPVDHPVAQALGADPLDSETALNVSAELRFQMSESAAFSLNVYRIDVDDRIVLSNFLAGDEVADLLAAQAIPGVVSARYFLNGVDTRTGGVDLAGNYLWQSPWGPIEFTAGFNLNDTDVTGSAATPPALAALGPGGERFGAREQAQLETWTPDSKLHLSARWRGERLTLDTRLQRYGEVTDVGPVPEQDLDLGTPWLLDVHARYRLTEDGYMGIGVHNLLDEYTEIHPREDSDPILNRVLPYSNYAPFGFNGRFVYLMLGLDLGG